MSADLLQFPIHALASNWTSADHRALRFLTAGSVDDGKSTLIGRLLYDSQAILADQLDALHKKAAGEAIDLSLLTDGLEAEREQGITIDVAYRYFATKARKFIIADAPGHEQYTRNMVTAAAGSDAAVILVDITKLKTEGSFSLLPQTRRHALLAHLLRVPNLVFAINKLDAVREPEQAFQAVEKAITQFAQGAGLRISAIVPVSALRGDNVTLPQAYPWYNGPSLLQVLEGLPPTQENFEGPLRLPVQCVARSGNSTGDQPRIFWGRIAQGSLQTGDEVQIFPSQQKARVQEIRLAGKTTPFAAAGQSAGVVLDRQLDISRGDWIHTPQTLTGTTEFSATLAWLDTDAAQVGRKYWLRHGNQWIQAKITAIQSCLDINTLQPGSAHQLQVNDIGRVRIQTQQPLPIEIYSDNRVGGSLIIVDPSTHRTSGALLVERS
jgi:sulfate adenylyltransferase subunit 1